MNNLIFFLILFTLCMGNTLGTTYLVLKNELNDKTLAVRCKSKDNNLGDHYLRVGQSFRFSFSDNFYKTTLFWCNMWKGPDYKIHQVFDAYRSKWKTQVEPTYIWVAREDGVYFREQPYGKLLEKRYDWK